jgi:hypothetical protein
LTQESTFDCHAHGSRRIVTYSRVRVCESTILCFQDYIYTSHSWLPTLFFSRNPLTAFHDHTTSITSIFSTIICEYYRLISVSLAVSTYIHLHSLLTSEAFDLHYTQSTNPIISRPLRSKWDPRRLTTRVRARRPTQRRRLRQRRTHRNVGPQVRRKARRLALDRLQLLNVKLLVEALCQVHPPNLV